MRRSFVCKQNGRPIFQPIARTSDGRGGADLSALPGEEERPIVAPRLWWAKVGEAVMAGTVDKAQQIADEAVGQARGAVPTPRTLISTIEDWVAEAEASIAKNPLISVVIAAAIGFGIAKIGRLR